MGIQSPKDLGFRDRVHRLLEWSGTWYESLGRVRGAHLPPAPRATGASPAWGVRKWVGGGSLH